MVSFNVVPVSKLVPPLPVIATALSNALASTLIPLVVLAVAVAPLPVPITMLSIPERVLSAVKVPAAVKAMRIWSTSAKPEPVSMMLSPVYSVAIVKT